MNSSTFDRGVPNTNPTNLHNNHISPGVASQPRPVSGSYFPSPPPPPPSQQQQIPHLLQPQQAPQRTPVDDETLSNTLANSHVATSSFPPDRLGLPNRQPKFTEEWDASVRGGSIIDGPFTQQPLGNHYQHQDPSGNMQRSNSVSSRTSRSEAVTGDGASGHQISLSRGNTLKKKNSLKRSGSLKRSSSRRSMKAGSVRSLALQSSHEVDEVHSAFYCPVPTTGNPTEALSNRFQAWRKILKDIITCFREIQSHYEHRSKSLLKLANVLNNTATPPGFLASGGLDDALQILRDYEKSAILEANKAREIEEDVILALTGLRSDLTQKIKEIKSLSGDFKNSVEKEMDATKKTVNALQDVLGQSERDPATTTGKQDPYLLRLAVDRQVERQLDEENYLHQAYLNLETSGRELESIVVGEIQKSYNAYAGILKRESDAACNAIDELRNGPIAMRKDHEWVSFVQRDSQFVDPEVPVRTAEQIHYPGRNHFACQEIRAGLLERKSKYLKSYTAGWYVLSATHLHEFKSADKTQAPIMSLYLPEQKLGSHSTEGGSSNKFILKGRQAGNMHRGHTWVFRAESHDTMMAWYEDIKALTEKSPEELSNFVRGHARTYSRSSVRSVSSDGMVDDEDEEPFSVDPAVASPASRHDPLQNRPEPGGRFPSDLQVNAQRGLQVPLSPSSSNSGLVENEYTMRGGGPTTANGNLDRDVIAAAGALPGSGIGGDPFAPGNRASLSVGQNYGNTPSVRMDDAPSHATLIEQEARQDGVNPYSGVPIQPREQMPRSISNGKFSNAPIVVEGPTSVIPPDSTRGTSMSTLSQDSGLPSSYDATSGDYARDFQRQEQSVGNGNIATKPLPPPASGGVPFTGAPQDRQIRPAKGERTNSTPHVPGEYPRGTPGETSGTY